MITSGETDSIPVHSYRGHGVDACEHGRDREEVVEFAVRFPEVPIPVGGVDKVDQGVQRGHRRLRKRQV